MSPTPVLFYRYMKFLSKIWKLFALLLAQGAPQLIAKAKLGSHSRSRIVYFFNVWGSSKESDWDRRMFWWFFEKFSSLISELHSLRPPLRPPRRGPRPPLRTTLITLLHSLRKFSSKSSKIRDLTHFFWDPHVEKIKMRISYIRFSLFWTFNFEMQNHELGFLKGCSWF